jgi:hypothetical protein
MSYEKRNEGIPMSKIFELYDSNDETLLQTADYGEIRKHVNKNRPDGYSVWEGHLDEDGDFVATLRVEFMHERPDDPRVAEHIGYHTPEDTPSLGNPWWTER